MKFPEQSVKTLGCQSRGPQTSGKLSDLSDAVDELVSDSFLEAVVYVFCDEPGHDAGPGDHCTDPLCGDMLFRVRTG